MTKEEIMKFINSNLACYLATSEQNQPRVRGMRIYRADENGIIFQTANTKDLYKQIVANPLVELCFYDQETRIQIRVKGKATIDNDIKLKKEVIEARPFLKGWVEKSGLDMVVVFRVTDCYAYRWSFDTNFAPKEYIKITV